MTLRYTEEKKDFFWIQLICIPLEKVKQSSYLFNVINNDGFFKCCFSFHLSCMLFLAWLPLLLLLLLLLLCRRHTHSELGMTHISIDQITRTRTDWCRLLDSFKYRTLHAFRIFYMNDGAESFVWAVYSGGRICCSSTMPMKSKRYVTLIFFSLFLYGILMLNVSACNARSNYQGLMHFMLLLFFFSFIKKHVIVNIVRRCFSI